MNLPTNNPRPSNPPARRAAVLLVLLAVGAGALAVLAVLFAVFMPQMQADPEMTAKLNQLRQQVPLDLGVLMTVTAVVFGVYAVAALVIGIGLFSGRRGWIIAALVLTLAVMLFMVLNTLSSIATGFGGLFPLLLVALHGLAAWWLMAALGVRQMPRAVAISNQFAGTPLPAPPQPMADYYLPLPTPPSKQQ